MSMVREIAEKYADFTAWESALSDIEIRQLAAHVLASTEPLGDEHFRHMEVARHLLPEPGPAVVGECLAEIRRLQAEAKGAQNINSHHVADLDDRDALIADLRAQLQTAKAETQEAHNARAVEVLEVNALQAQLQAAQQEIHAWEESDSVRISGILDKEIRECCTGGDVGVPAGTPLKDGRAYNAEDLGKFHQLATPAAALPAQPEEGCECAGVCSISGTAICPLRVKAVDIALAVPAQEHSDTAIRPVVNSFFAYLKEHPQQRFWQALRNWSGYGFILAANNREGHNIDTFGFADGETIREAIDAEMQRDAARTAPEAQK